MADERRPDNEMSGSHRRAFDLCIRQELLADLGRRMAWCHLAITGFLWLF
jgi:hypothetical protein